jgi:glycosyltransferase involved in cell wall biosynthesis
LNSTRPNQATVVIPAHNHARFVAEAVASASAQGPAVAEIIVIDDGSTDGTSEVVRQLTEPRLKLITQSNRGPSTARNAGWRTASTGWIQFLDADDMLEPGAVPALLAAAEKNPGMIPFGIQTVCGENMKGEPAFTGQISTTSGRLVDELCIWYYASIFTALIPRRVLEEINGFDEQIIYGEDFDLAVRLGLGYSFVYVPQFSYRTRMHSSNRHRAFTAARKKQYLATVSKNLGRRAGLPARWRYHRAMAQWLWRFGMESLAVGNPREAAEYFRRAWFHQPTKLSALRGWLGSQFKPNQPASMKNG